ncbi:BON domain-containing protein [Myxococcus sp. K15C18031901]|uniref:BON domain-containing protein n=1 Tax=Myxococcus dinghuensis TaxID=2906761 RepID=UPI0020A7C263|nr:BON domain-containing protein [Myxococcus dinghuensis]MCP3103520.1 BON domain-containing protein [Myxococcus dinghuensis]
MGNRRDEDRRGGGPRHPRDDHQRGHGHPMGRGPEDAGPERGSGRDSSRDWHVAPGRHRDPWYPSRDLDRDRDYRTLQEDRDRLDYEIDRDFGDSAREMDRARPPGRSHDDYYRALDRRARAMDPERIARRPGYSPSGTFRALDERSPRDASRGGPPSRPPPRDGPPPHRQGEVGHTRYGQRGVDEWDEPDAWLDELRELGPRERPAEADVRLGGTQPSGHGPGVENMAPPVTGFSTSPSRRGDHDLGHGGYVGSGARPRPPMDARRAATGRPPRGYQRGDTRIRADICDRLMQGWMDVGDVEVQVEDGVVTLMGRVRGRDEKRAIEDVADAVLGVKEVLNHIRLDRTEGVLHPPSSREPLQATGEEEEDEHGPLHA